MKILNLLYHMFIGYDACDNRCCRKDCLVKPTLKYMYFTCKYNSISNKYTIFVGRKWYQR